MMEKTLELIMQLIDKYGWVVIAYYGVVLFIVLVIFVAILVVFWKLHKSFDDDWKI